MYTTRMSVRLLRRLRDPILYRLLRWKRSVLLTPNVTAESARVFVVFRSSRYSFLSVLDLIVTILSGNASNDVE